MTISMSSNFFPMLSSSPPPIDDADTPENDDDDDFGMFSASNNVFECSFDSPISDKSACSIEDLHNHKNACSDESDIVLENDGCDSYSHAYPEVHSGQLLLTSVKKGDSGNIPERTKFKSVSSESSHKEGNATFNSQQNLDGHANSECSTPLRTCNTEPIDLERETEGDLSSSRADPAENSSHESVSASTLQNLSDGSATIVMRASVLSEQSSQDVEEAVARANNSSEMPISISTTMSSDVDKFHGGLKGCKGASLASTAISNNESVSAVTDFPLTPLEKEGDNHVTGSLTSENDDRASSLGTEPPDLNLTPFLTAADDNGDVDDFEEFQDAHVAENNSSDSPYDDDYDDTYRDHGKCSSQYAEESEDESFGNFECVKPVIFEPVSKSKCVSKLEATAQEEFSNFQGSHLPISESEAFEENLESDDFADFESAGFGDDMKVPVTQPYADRTEPSLKGIDKITKIVNNVFLVPAVLESESVAESNCDVLEQNCKSRRLWERLHDTDQTPGLPFQWGVSHSFQQLLRSVNVDYHSILRTSTVPFFASGLGLLEPTKGIVATSLSEENYDSNRSCKEPIPPVHFDWGSSGLVNPLDSVQSASTLMDLSFLNSSAPTKVNLNGKKDFSLEKELLEPSPVVVSSESNLKPQILKQLLSAAASCSVGITQPCHRPPNLSQEALHVLDQLPDISFMRAKVLMFPVSNT